MSSSNLLLMFQEIQRSMDDMKKEHSMAISDVKKSEIYMKERDEWKQKYEDLQKEFRLTQDENIKMKETLNNPSQKGKFFEEKSMAWLTEFFEPFGYYVTVIDTHDVSESGDVIVKFHEIESKKVIFTLLMDWKFTKKTCIDVQHVEKCVRDCKFKDADAMILVYDTMPPTYKGILDFNSMKGQDKISFFDTRMAFACDHTHLHVAICLLLLRHSNKTSTISENDVVGLKNMCEFMEKLFDICEPHLTAFANKEQQKKWDTETYASMVKLKRWSENEQKCDLNLKNIKHNVRKYMSLFPENSQHSMFFDPERASNAAKRKLESDSDFRIEKKRMKTQDDKS